MEPTEIWVRWDYNALSSFRGNGSVEFNFRLKFITLETLFLELVATVLLNWLQQPTTQFCLQLQLWSVKSNFSFFLIPVFPPPYYDSVGLDEHETEDDLKTPTIENVLQVFPKIFLF